MAEFLGLERPPGPKRVSPDPRKEPVWLKIPAVSTPLKFLGLGVY